MNGQGNSEYLLTLCVLTCRKRFLYLSNVLWQMSQGNTVFSPENKITG